MTLYNSFCAICKPSNRIYLSSIEFIWSSSVEILDFCYVCWNTFFNIHPNSSYKETCFICNKECKGAHTLSFVRKFSSTSRIFYRNYHLRCFEEQCSEFILSKIKMNSLFYEDVNKE